MSARANKFIDWGFDLGGWRSTADAKSFLDRNAFKQDPADCACLIKGSTTALPAGEAFAKRGKDIRDYCRFARADGIALNFEHHPEDRDGFVGFAAVSIPENRQREWSQIRLDLLRSGEWKDESTFDSDFITTPEPRSAWLASSKEACKLQGGRFLLGK